MVHKASFRNPEFIGIFRRILPATADWSIAYRMLTSSVLARTAWSTRQPGFFLVITNLR